jgi:hypothetical protein
MSLQLVLTSIPGPFPACCEISKTSLQPFSLMQSSQINGSVFVMHHIHDGPEYRIICIKFCARVEKMGTKTYG